MMVKGNCVKLRLILVTLITYILTTNTAVADFEQRANTNIFSIGFGAKAYSAPYSGQNGYVEPFPLIQIELNGFFLKDYTVGYRFYNHKRVSLALAANYGREFLEVDEINSKNEILYYGIEDKDSATEVGFVAQFFSRVGLVEGTYFKDVTNTHDGSRASLKISRSIPDTGKWEVVPSFYVNYFSEKFNNYYYGVSQEENDIGEEIALNLPSGAPIRAEEFSEKIRPTYIPGNSGHVGFALDMKYAFTDHVKAIINIAIEKFAGEVETSPLIEDKQLMTAVIGLAYEF
jgi:outer membrane scaffolding protein for murein synthesis (MipA/OmpV family)